MSNNKKLGETVIIICGTYYEDYPRDDTTIKALKRLPFKKIVDIKNDFPHWRIEKRLFLQNILRRAAWIRNFFQAVYHIIRSGCTVVYVLHDNHELGAALSVFTRIFRRGTVVMYDNWISITFQSISNYHTDLRIRYCNFLEYLINRFAGIKMVTTKEYAGYFASRYKCPIQNYFVVPNAVPDIWLGRPKIAKLDNKKIKIVYWGLFLVQHGLDIAIEAADILKNDNFEFILYGFGKGKRELQCLIEKKGLKNVAFREFISDQTSLIQCVDEADMTFGHLKNVFDSGLMTPNKLIQGMSRGKVVLSIYSKQQEEFYTKDNNGTIPLILFDGTPKDLAGKMKTIGSQPDVMRKISQAAVETAKKHHSIDSAAEAFLSMFRASGYSGSELIK